MRKGESKPQSGGSMNDMDANYIDMLKCLNKAGVDYILVGGWAVNLHGYVRATVDLDVWICANAENAKKVYEALSDFGAPVSGMTPKDFEEDGMIFQIGVAPCRIDVITRISGVEYCDAVKRAQSRIVEGLPVRVISLDDLITNKKSSARPKDLLDVRQLEGRRV